ncbi:hypothetical protein ABK040_006139 [Willaertia magna]
MTDRHDVAYDLGSAIGDTDSSYSRSTRSKSSSITLRGGNSTIRKAEDALFFFIFSVKIRKAMPGWLSILLHILFMYQSLVLGIESDFPYGDDGRFALKMICIPRSLGANFYPYESFIGIAVALFVIEALCIMLFYFSYKALHRGSKYWDKIKLLVRLLAAFFAIFGIILVFDLTTFIACDYSKPQIVDGSTTYHLRRFTDVACWSPLNGAFTVLSYIFMFAEIPLTFIGVLIFAETSVKGKSYFTMSSPFLLSFLLAANQLFLIISQSIPPQGIISRPVLFIVISLLFIILLFYELPFVNRSANSVYSGFAFARVGMGLGSLITVAVNTDNQNVLGLILLFAVAIGSSILFFIIGFITMEIYTRVVMFIGRSTIRAVKDGDITIPPDLSEIISFRNMNLFLRFSLNASSESGDFELGQYFIKTATNQRLDLNAYLLVTSALFIRYTIEDTHSQQFALHLLRKASKQNSNILMRYIIYQRSKDIEHETATGKNTYELRNIINNVTKFQEKLRQYQKLFWKHFVSNEENNERVYNLVKVMHKYIEDSSKTFNNLLVNYHNNSFVIRSYAQFVEEFLYETEVAEELYNEANILEEEESKKRKVVETKNRGKNNRIVPLAFEEEPQTNNFAKMENINEDMLESASQAYYTNKKDKQILYRTAVNKPQEHSYKFLFLQTLGVFSMIVIAVILGMDLGLSNDGERIQTVNDFCQTSPVSYATLAGIRYIQLLYQYSPNSSLFYSEYKTHKNRLKVQTSVLNKILDMVNQNKFSSEMMQEFVANNKPIIIPVVSPKNDATSLVSYVKNSSVSEITNLMSSVMGTVYDWSNNDYLQIYSNFEFLFLWNNRVRVTSVFEEFCTNLISSNEVTLNRQKQIFIFTVVGVSIVYLFFIIVYLVFALFHLQHLVNITKLFTKIPKDVVGMVFHALEQKAEDKIVKVPNSFLTPRRLITFFIFSIALITVTASALLLYESISIMNNSYQVMLKVQHGSVVLQIAQRAKYKLGELLMGQNATSLGVNLKEFHDDILKHSQDLMRSWLNFRFGTIDQGFSGINGVSSAIDKILLTQNCTFANYSCYGVDQLMDLYGLASDRLNEDAISGSYTALSLFNNFVDIFSISSEITAKMFSIMSYYVSNFKSPNRIISPVISSISLVSLLILVYLKYTEFKKFDSEAHQLRRMLNFLPYSVFEQDEEIRNYVLFYTFSEGKKKTKTGGHFSKTKAILDAAVDGAFVINSKTAFIDIINPSALNMLGYKSEEVVNSSALLLFADESRDKLMEIISDMATSATSYGKTLEVEARRKNGTYFPARISLSVSWFGKNSFVSAFFKDITSERKHYTLIEEEKKKSDALLLNILPEQVAKRLKQGETYIAEKVDDVTCLFSDIVQFTLMSSGMSAVDLVQMLNSIINGFDSNIIKYNLEKIKTIGDAYFCVGGLQKQSDHPEKVVRFAIDMFSVIRQYNIESGKTVNVRIGVHTGGVTAGCIGTLKFAFDLWGETVIVGSKMESTGLPGRIQVSRQTYERIYDLFDFEERKGVEVKDKMVTTYLLKDKHHMKPIPLPSEKSPEKQQVDISVSTPTSKLNEMFASPIENQ